MSPHAENNQEIRRYLLGGLSQKVLRQVEERLMNEDGFFEELLLVEDELIDDYVGDQLSLDERRRFEQHFLSTPERHGQLRFAQALSRYVSNSSAKSETESPEDESARAQRLAPTPEPTWAERFRAFWGSRAWALRTAAALAVVVVIAGAFWLLRPRTTPPQTFATLTLTTSISNRAEGVQAAKVKLPLNADALRIFLTL